ncbi:choline transporter-like 1 [Tribolium castaneum]|uniref:choline transporter-like 1 n=1 Tax=Tribolium castaneum TaxID=7070 RepID=UPI00046BF0E0|nr:PREDICTED: CTL-like protein 1 [Tribolium castaneum]|eukprot:XP_008197900.1 PREDICTED: CTL-like protein 1 [Tribolium castaneum]
MGCCESKKEPEREEPAQRGCTDVFWLCLYIAFWLLMVLIAAFSFVYGNPIRIINGYDSFGNICGTKNNRKMSNLEVSGLDTSDKQFLLFYDIKELKQSLKICVKQCPTETLKKVEDIQKYYQKTGVSLCRYDFNYDDFKNKSIANKEILSSYLGPCPALPIYESTPVLNRCVPKSFQDAGEAILSNFYEALNSWDTLEQILGDIYSTWKEILYLTFLSLFFSLLTISILHLLAHLVSYIIMILFTIASILGTAFLWYTYFDIKYDLDKTNKHMLLMESIRNETAFLWYSIIATVITVIILLIVAVMRKQVNFLSDLFKETSKCLLHLPALFLQPILTFIILVLFFMFWIFVVLCLATAYYPGTSRINRFSNESFTTPVSHTEPVAKLGNISLTEKFLEKMTVVEFTDPTWVKYMWWVYFIGLIWTCEFIMGCQQMVIAGAVAHWFYRHKYKDNSHVSYAICKLIKYHLGSVAIGSLLITIFKVPRLILMFLHEKLKYNSDKGSECASCLLKCCICCFWCLEKFIRYLNHNAYTVIAIDGVNFCSAAGTAFQVLSSHALQVATINGLGDFILFLGKCLVTVLTGCVGLFIFRRNPDLEFYAAPTLVVCIFAFFVAHCILSLYEMVLDTVYLCICQNGESVEGIQMENLGVRNVGNLNAQPNELEPIK